MNIDTPEKRAMLNDYCEKFEATPSRTLARLIFQEHPELFPSFDAAYQAVRARRGNKGNKLRKHINPKHFRPNGKAEFVWSLPESKADKWTPFCLSDGTIAVLSDIHLPFHDDAALNTAIELIKKRKPSTILLNGDTIDFFTISRFDKNVTKTKLVEEIKQLRQFLGWLRQTFPKSRIIYKEGNHDERMDLYVWRKAPELVGLTSITLQKLACGENIIEGEDSPAINGIEWVKDQRIIKCGKLDILHGHETGKGGANSPVNPARGYFLKTFGCTLSGHLHRSSQHDERTVRNKLISCWSTGCLCDMNPEYARINKWNHGFAIVELKGEQFEVDNKRIINGKVY